MQVVLVRLMSKIKYLIMPKGTKFTGSGKLGLILLLLDIMLKLVHIYPIPCSRVIARKMF